MHRSATARWAGSLHKGQGRLDTQSAALEDARFSFPTRFGAEVGTNPEELIAAAHAGCFSMAFAYFVEAAGLARSRSRRRRSCTSTWVRKVRRSRGCICAWPPTCRAWTPKNCRPLPCGRRKIASFRACSTRP